MRYRLAVVLSATALAAAALAPGAVQAQDDTSLPTLSIANATVAEDAGGVSLTVILSAESTQAVTVAYSGIDGTAKEGDGDYSLTDGTLSIPALSTTGTIPLTIHDDDVDEANETFKIRLSSPSNAGFAGDNSTIESTVTITDDDTRGVSVSPTSLDIDESDDQWYSVWLNSEPTATVTVTPSAHGDTDVTVSGALTFTPEDWDTAQKVIVSTDVDTDDDDDAATIRHAVSGGDYTSVAASNVSVIVEDIIATSTAVRLRTYPSSVSEGDGETTVTLTGQLNGLPRDSDTTVSVSVGASGDTATEGTDYSTVDDLTLTIKEGDAGASATFKLTPVDNDVDQAAKRLTVSGSTQGLSVTGTTVYISDDDTRGVNVSETRRRVNEGNSITYSIMLESEPTANVTVTPSIKWVDDHVSVSLSGAVTFTAENWDEWQRVTVSALDDPDAAGGQVSISHSISGGDYGSETISDVRVTVIEDDTRGVTVSLNSLEINEGESGTYTVVLDTQPVGDDVTVTPSIKRADDGVLVTLSDALTFTADNWDEPQTMTVTANQDVDGESGQLIILHDVRGGDYWGMGVRDRVVTVVDDETETTKLIVAVDPDSVNEDDGPTTVTLTIEMDAAPFSTWRTMYIRPGWPSGQHMVQPDLSFSGSELVEYFSPGETRTTRTFTVTPIDDDYFEEPASVHISASFTHDEVRGFATVRIIDDDPPPGVSISETSVDLDEGGSTTYTVVLESKPLTDVTVTPWVPDSDSEVTTSGKLTFTGENWDEPQTITVTAAHDDDGVDDTAVIRHNMRGGAYRFVAADAVSVTVDDDDTPGVRISTTMLELREGRSAAYRIGLDTQPSETVTITLTLDGDADLTIRGDTLLTVRERELNFSRSFYGSRVVWVSALHDADAVDDIGTISHSVSGGEYDSMTVADLSITVDDDEIPPDLALNLHAIAGDNAVNIAEKAAGFTISGDTGSTGGVDVTVTVGSKELTTTSADADPASWSVSVPANAAYITGTSVDVSVNASKTGHASRTVTRSLAVDLSAPTAPTYTTVPGSLKVDEEIAAMSPSGGSGIDAYSATGLPSGLSVNASTGVISGTPDTADANTASVAVTVSDTAGNTDTVNLTFPAVAKGDQAFTRFVYNSSPVTLGLPAPRLLTPTGPKTAVSYSASPSTVCTVDSSTGELTIVGVGDCVITATAAATANYNQATATFTLPVRAPTPGLTAPTYAAPSSLKVGVRITDMTPSGGSAINRFSAAGLPLGLSINTETGVISGTPSAANANTATATVTVSGTPTNTRSVTITFPAVAKGDQALRGFRYSASSATIDSSAPTVTAPSGAVGTVLYSASPSSVCTVDLSTGALTLAGAGTCRITATAVSTSNYNQGTATFTVTVSEPSVRDTLTAPTYTAPGSLKVGVRITSMSPSGGSGINGYSASGLPSGLSINSSTGVISGTPRAANSSRATATVTVSNTASNTATVSITFPAVARGDQTLSGFRYSASSATIGSSAPTVTAPSGARGTVSYSASPSSVCTVNSSSGALTLIGAGTCRITATAASTSNYNRATAIYTVTVQAAPVSNDEPGLTVSRTGLTLAEGASADYTVVLDSTPTEDVTVTLSVRGSPDLTVDPTSLTFTANDWFTAQTIAVSAAEDDDASHDSAIVSHAAEGGDYAALVGGELAVTITDNEVESQEGLPAQVSGLSATATATHVDLAWSAVEDTVLGYRVEASYDRGANWAEVEDNTESTDVSFRHAVGLNFAESRRYRVSAVDENGAGLPSAFVQVSATATADGLTAAARTPEDETDSMSGETSDSMSDGANSDDQMPDDPMTDDSMTDDSTDAVPSIDLCWIPEGVTASELSAIAVATSRVSASGSGDAGNLVWQSIGSGSTEVDCEDGIGFRTTSVSSNQRYAFRMRARHAGAWLVSNVAEAVLADSSKPLRTVVTAGTSGVSGDTTVPDPICRDYDDPATSQDEAGSFLVTIGFTTASDEYLRYEPVEGFNTESDLALANATAELLDRPHDTLLGYRVRITPRVWGSPVSIIVPADVVTHGATAVGNQASGSFRRDTSDEVDCDTSAPEPARRAQVATAQIEPDGDRGGEWTAGEPIRVTLRFDERVSVDTTDGVPGVTLTLGEAEAETTDESSDNGETGTEGTDQSTDGGTETDDTGQSTEDGETATDVSALFFHLAHGDTLVFEHVVTADESPVRHIALKADSLALNGGQIASFSGPAADLAHPGAAVVDGQVEQADLAADWSSIPAAHGGSESEFEVRLKFSEAVDLIEVIGETKLIEHAFTVTNGSIESIRHIRDRQGEFLADEWAISVMADSEETVTVAPVVELACDQTGAVCTVDDRPLAEAPSAIVHRTGQTLSVADARVEEGPDAELEFEVNLARPADRTVTVGYETGDVTATAGEDYEETRGTLSIEAGQSTATIRVPVLDDEHDEGEETLTLNLTDPTNTQLLNEEAVGTIVNSDPMPSAWLARFGRAASDHVAQAVARRVDRRSSEEHLTLGGVRLDRLFTGSGEQGSGLDRLFVNSSTPGTAAGAAPGTFASTHAGQDTSSSTQFHLAPRVSGSLQTPPAWAGSRSGNSASHDGRTDSSRTLPTLHDALLGSSFFHTFGEGEDEASGPLTAWGETAVTRFNGSEGALSLDGEVTTAMLGLDKQYGRWLLGATLSYSEGEGGYRRSGGSPGSGGRPGSPGSRGNAVATGAGPGSAAGGTIQSTLTSLNPYAHFELNDATSLWGVIGYGVGRMQLSPDGAESALETDLSNRMAAFGGRRLLSARTGETGRFELALRSDALLTHTDSEAVQGLAAAQGGTSRVRLLLEGSGSLPLWRGVLRPTLEAGLRYDGGDAETGAGLEIGGGLAHSTGRLSVEVNARGLVAHEDTAYEEWGYSGSLGYQPRNDGTGLSMTLGSAWGATQGGAQSLWSRADAAGFVPGSAMDPGQRFQAEFGYGLHGRNGRALWAPFVAAETGQGGSQSLRLGLKLTSESNLEAGLEIGRRGAPRGEAQHAIQLRGSMRW